VKLSAPVFILAPPRSGSTLLFETLSHCAGLWTLGDEGHGIIEEHPSLTPRPFSDQSNRLTAGDLNEGLAAQIRQTFLDTVRDRNGRRPDAGVGELRLLEKTPKNILRIPFFLELFPDAKFIYLYRDARENISSIIDGWRSGRFRTYLDKQTPHGLWSFLLPPDWSAYRNRPLADIAAFQWQACHDYAMRDLAALPPQRWCALNFQSFLNDTEAQVEELCRFMGVSMDMRLREYCRNKLPPSRYTLTPPAASKWQRNARELAPLMAEAAQVAARINAFTAGLSLPLETELEIVSPAVTQESKISRNEPCPCGSNKRYKHCHGRI